MQRLRITTLIVSMSVICLFLTNCQQGPIRRTELTPPLLRFNTQQFAPYTYEENGVAGGPIGHIIQEACNRAGIPCRLSLLDWQKAQQQVKDGLSDGLFVVGWNAARANWFHYSVPLLESEYGLFSQTDRIKQFSDISELKGRTVAVQGPSNMSKVLSRIKLQLNNDLNIRVFTTLQSCFDQLIDNQNIDAVYADKAAGKAYLYNNGDHGIRYIGRHQRLQYFVGVSKQVDLGLFDAFNKALQALRKEGEVQKVLEEYGLLSSSKFSCKTSLRNSPGTLTPYDVTSLRRRLRGKLYNSSWFDDLSCGYAKRFRPYGRGVVVDHAINVMWELSPNPIKRTWRKSLSRLTELNKKKYGGFNDWRLPTVEELYAILLFGDYEQNYFIDHLTKGHKLPFWSADKLRHSQHRWAVDFVDGGIAPSDANEWLGVIAVRTADRKNK